LHRGYAAGLVGDQVATERMLRTTVASHDSGVTVVARRMIERPVLNARPACREMRGVREQPDLL
jgi:hypothetical protein